MDEFYVNDFLEVINELFPFELAEKWDNVGLQIATRERKIKKVFITLDVTEKVVEYVKKNEFDLIISHHPIIFKPLYTILPLKNSRDRIIKELLCNDIPLIVVHTNADKVLFYQLAEIAGLSNFSPLIPDTINPEIGFGAVGSLEEKVTLKDFLNDLKKKLNINIIKYTGDDSLIIKKIAVCGGTCTSFINEELKDKGIDLFITSDIKYHEAQRAVSLGFNIVDAGHFYTEQILLPEIKRKLEEVLKDKILVEVSRLNKDIFKYL